MKQQFQSVLSRPVTGPLALYLLDATGKVRSVRAPSTDSNRGAVTDAAEAQTTGTLLDRALDKAPLMGPADLKNRAVRTKTTYNALDDLSSAMKLIPGSKRLLWITYGIPSQIHMTDGWQDLTQVLLQLGGRFIRASTVVYSLDPGIDISGGLMNRDGLDILTAATGGITFVSSDLPKAVEQARNDNAFNYLLRYTPVTRDSPDHYHTVRITTGHKGIHLRAQQIYFPYAAN